MALKILGKFWQYFLPLSPSCICTIKGNFRNVEYRRHNRRAFVFLYHASTIGVENLIPQRWFYALKGFLRSLLFSCAGGWHSVNRELSLVPSTFYTLSNNLLAQKYSKMIRSWLYFCCVISYTSEWSCCYWFGFGFTILDERSALLIWFCSLSLNREVAASPALLNMPDRVHWKACKVSEDEETKMAGAFRKKFQPYDFNLD